MPKLLENTDITDVWAEFKEKGTQESRNLLIEHYLPLVKATAERLRRKLPANVESGDLVNAGIFGLMNALKGFDPERGVKFETYSAIRIRGAMLDELRSWDWVPRLVRSKSHEMRRAVDKLEQKLGRKPHENEIAKQLGMEKPDYEKFSRKARKVSMVSLNERWPDQQDYKSLRKIDLLEDHRSETPLQQANRNDLLAVAARTLCERDRDIVLLYYFEGLTMREIGAILGLSESRVCQLHGRIMTQLRNALAKEETDLFA